MCIRNNMLGSSGAVSIGIQSRGSTRDIKWWGIWMPYCVCRAPSHRKATGIKWLPLQKWENVFGTIHWKGEKLKLKISLERWSWHCLQMRGFGDDFVYRGIVSFYRIDTGLSKLTVREITLSVDIHINWKSCLLEVVSMVDCLKQQPQLWWRRTVMCYPGCWLSWNASCSTSFSRPFFLSYQLSLTFGSILRIAVVLQLKIPEYKAQN